MVMTGKVAIIGAGFVGSTAAYALMIDGVASEIALIDVHKEKAEGEAMDLEHGMQFVPRTKITFGNDYKLCKDAEIIVICAGAHQKEGETRLDLVQKNAAIFKEMIPSIMKHNKDCILVIVSNPADILAYLTIKYSKLPWTRVFSTGTSLDTARLRFMLGEYYGVDPTSVHAYMLGEHGDTEFPCWSTANIAGIPLENFEKYNKKEMSKIYDQTRKAAYEVIARKGATYYAVGLVIARVVRVILTDKNVVMPVSTLLKNYHGVSDVCLSIPCVLNRKGIKKQLMLPLNAAEEKALKHSADTLKEYISKVKFK